MSEETAETKAESFPWLTLGALAGAALLGAFAIVELEVQELLLKGKPHRLAQANLIQGMQLRAVLALFLPLLLVLAAFHPTLLAALRARPRQQLACLAGLLPLLALVLPAVNFFGAGFDLYAPLLVLLAGIVLIYAPPSGGFEKGLGGALLLVWLFLWLPLDLRWYQTLWKGPSKLSYATFAAVVSALGILVFAVSGRLDSVGLRLPRLNDLWQLLLWAAGLSAVLLPLAFATGFITPSAASASPYLALLGAVSLALTVALPEELFFRGVLDSRLQEYFKRPWVSLIFSSVAFGLMHWNNRDDLLTQLLYVLLATLAGVFYGLAFRKSKGLVAPIALHTTVDLVWQLWLRG